MNDTKQPFHPFSRNLVFLKFPADILCSHVAVGVFRIYSPLTHLIYYYSVVGKLLKVRCRALKHTRLRSECNCSSIVFFQLLLTIILHTSSLQSSSIHDIEPYQVFSTHRCDTGRLHVVMVGEAQNLILVFVLLEGHFFIVAFVKSMFLCLDK